MEGESKKQGHRHREEGIEDTSHQVRVETLKSSPEAQTNVLISLICPGG